MLWNPLRAAAVKSQGAELGLAEKLQEFVGCDWVQRKVYRANPLARRQSRTCAGVGAGSETNGAAFLRYARRMQQFRSPGPCAEVAA